MAFEFGQVVFGGNVFGWTVNAADAFRVLDAFVDHGGVSIDTADSYVAWAPGGKGGESEEIIGSWMAERGNRDKLVVATKVAQWAQQPGLSPDNLRSALEGSLRRLKTDYIDIYYAHEDDQEVEQAAYMEAFDAFVREGKVRAVGASNFSAARLTSALEIAKSNGWKGFAVSQDRWNLAERDLETDFLPVLQKYGVTELPYYALASGFLTGKYRPGVEVASARAAAGQRYLRKPFALPLLAKLDELAAAHGVSVAAVALAWLRAQPTVGAPIASARTVEQIPALFETVTLAQDELAALGAITA